MNTCTFMGNITKNGVKTSTYGDGKTKVNFQISIYKGKDQKTTYVPFVAFGKSAEMIAKYFTAGSPINVTASFGTFETQGNNGEKKYGYNFTVENINFLPKNFSNGNNNINHTGTAGSNNGVFGNGNNDNFFSGDSYNVSEDDIPFGM